ncbi:hypothetical protein X767_27405 [Mesorhizobium sp. LSJC264A00]|nr:hypothetical protein X767_27405 [Mesorhizobium sp. LSJC264A00]
MACAPPGQAVAMLPPALLWSAPGVEDRLDDNRPLVAVAGLQLQCRIKVPVDGQRAAIDGAVVEVAETAVRWRHDCQVDMQKGHRRPISAGRPVEQAHFQSSLFQVRQ